MISRTLYLNVAAALEFALAACTQNPSQFAEDADAEYLACADAAANEEPERAIEICDEAAWAITALQIEYPDAPEEQQSQVWFSLAFTQDAIATQYAEETGDTFDVNSCSFREDAMSSLSYVSRAHVDAELYDPFLEINAALVETCSFMLGLP